ncbi:MAG: hypothetical protein WBA51_04795 [Erythrobacter sp.]
MSRLPDQFYQDRALRDAARTVLKADVEHARSTLSGKGIASRVGSRIGDGAKDVLEMAKVHAEDKRGIIAGLIAAVTLWFMREPLLEIFGLGSAAESPEGELEDDLAGDVEKASDQQTGEDKSDEPDAVPDPAPHSELSDNPLEARMPPPLGDEHD